MARPSPRASAVALAGVAVAALWILIGATAAAAASGPSPSAEQQFIDAVNRERGAHGAPAVALDGELTGIARHWADRLAADGRLSHNADLPNQVTADWEKLAENVGTGGGVDAIHQAFMASATHRANILDPDLTHVGLGVVDTGDQLWVTENFMRLRPAPAAAVAPAAAPVAAPAPAPAPTPVAPAATPASVPVPAAPEPAALVAAPTLTVDDVRTIEPALASWAWGSPATAAVTPVPVTPMTAAAQVSSPAEVPVLPVGVVGAIALGAVVTAAAADPQLRSRVRLRVAA
jgi:uncharacterized protein YkwD